MLAERRVEQTHKRKILLGGQPPDLLAEVAKVPV
jgi:hypothetical protein